MEKEKCKKCNGTGWIIKKSRLPLSEVISQERCDCGYWVKDGIKYRKKRQGE